MAGKRWGLEEFVELMLSDYVHFLKICVYDNTQFLFASQYFLIHEETPIIKLFIHSSMPQSLACSLICIQFSVNMETSLLYFILIAQFYFLMTS